MAYISTIEIVNDKQYLIEPTLYITPSKNGTAYTASLANFSLTPGVTVQAKFAATNEANATLNINSEDAKEIHYNGAKITASQFKVNHVYTLVYDGKQWQVAGDIDTNSNTTYTFANGTNGFTVTPSGGTAQTVTVTPSIANNITGSGTANYITKFTGANTIGNSGLTTDTNNNLTVPGSIYFGGNTSSGKALFSYNATYPKHGIWYKDATNDIMSFSASGNADSGTSADFAIENKKLYNLGNIVPNTGNTTGNVGGTTTPVYVEAGVIKAGTALGTASQKAESYFAKASHNHAASDINSGTFDTDRIPNLSWNKITSDKPTTLSGYGITDAKIVSDIITLGSNTITPITSIADLTGSTITATNLRTKLGLSAALRFIGKATTDISESTTTAPTVTGVTNYAPEVGDVVLDKNSDAEYVCIAKTTTNNTTTYTWELLGRSGSWATNTHAHGNITNGGLLGTANMAVVTDGSKKITTADLSVTDTNASTNATTTFVQAVTQNAQGKITVTKASLNTSGTWSGTATYITTTADTSNALYPLGVTSGATTTLKRDTSITMAGGTISATKFQATHTAGGQQEFRVTYGSTIDMSFMVGTGNENHGIYDSKKSDWVLLAGSANTWSFKGNADTASSAAKLTTARNLGVALGSTTAVTFDGSANQTSIPVSGTLDITHGGTGQTTLTAARQQFSGPEFIVGTWTAASGTWTGTTTDSALYDGKQIILYMPFAGRGNATLNLTLANGNTTGAKNVYFESTTRFTTHKGQNSQLHLIYHSGLKLSNGTTYEGWWYVANRDTDNDYRTRQNVLADTDTNNRSLLLANPAVGTANNNTAYVAYRNDKIYANVNTGIITATGFNGDLTGNATTANTATSADKWTTARTLTIGNKGQSVDGSGNVSWSLADIGAAPSSTVSCTTANVKSALGTGSDTTKYLNNKGEWAVPTYTTSLAWSAITNKPNLSTGNARIFYGTSNTAAGTAAKVVTCSIYDAYTAGDILVVKFDNANTAGSPTLNVNSKGAKNIRKIYNGAVNTLNANGEITGTCMFVYDGAQWLLTNADYNNTYTIPTSFSITANATDGLWNISGSGGNNQVTYAVEAYSSKQTGASFYTGTANPDGTTRLNYNGYLYATKLYSNGTEVSVSGHTHNYLSAISWSGDTNLKLKQSINGAAATDVLQFAAGSNITLTGASGKITIAGTANDAVTHTLSTITKYYVTGTTSATTSTGGDTFDTGIYATTTAGQLNATSYKVNEKVTLQWNSTDNSLDFVFA